jgi:hypothetical protein
MVTPRHVLTAAHVALGREAAAVTVWANLGATPTPLPVQAVLVYPGADFPYHDLALLQLSESAPVGVAVYPVVDTLPPAGATATLVGYGSSGTGDVGPTVPASPQVKRVGRNVIDQYTDRLDATGRIGAFFLYDFDGPSGNGPLGGPTLGNAQESTVAGGDSGSPSFVDVDGAPALFALNTAALQLSGTAASTFGSGGAGTVLAYPPYLSWLREQTQQGLQLTSQRQADSVPTAPAWALGLLGAALLVPAWRWRTSASPAP